jgi:hypothetical protein
MKSQFRATVQINDEKGERGGGNLTGVHLDRFVIDKQTALDFQ